MSKTFWVLLLVFGAVFLALNDRRTGSGPDGGEHLALGSTEAFGEEVLGSRVPVLAYFWAPW